MATPAFTFPPACEFCGAPDTNMKLALAEAGQINPVLSAPDFFARNAMICPACRALTKDLLDLFRPVIAAMRADRSVLRLTLESSDEAAPSVRSVTLRFAPEDTVGDAALAGAPPGFVES